LKLSLVWSKRKELNWTYAGIYFLSKSVSNDLLGKNYSVAKNHSLAYETV